MPRQRLGEILKEKGLLDEKELEEALRIQQVTGERLGRILVRLGIVAEPEIVSALAGQLDLPEVNLFEEVEPDLLHRILPQSLVVRYKAIPVRQQGNRLLVAMADPLDVVAIDDLQQICQLEIQPAIASEQEVERFIGQFYDLQELVVQAERSQELLFETGVAWEVQESDQDEALMIRLVNTSIRQAVKMKASDLHFEPTQGKVRVRFRIDGLLREMVELPLGILPPLVSRIKIMAGLDITERRLPQDGRFQISLDRQQINLRVSTVPTAYGEKVVLRILDGVSSLILLENLGLSNNALTEYRRLIMNTDGMVLITGPTGSGKTSTLYATLHELNNSEQNIMTIEDPVEYLLNGINQIRVNNKQGLDFATGLRAILRQDPDIIMVGEIRDQETAQIAVRAAITGHLVFSTLHTADAAGAVTRLLDMGIEPYLVASSLKGVVAQRLVRRLCPHCQEYYQPEPGSPEAVYLERLGFPLVEVARGRGCRRCEQTGYKGRIAILEVLAVTRELRQRIMARATSDELKRVAINNGMVSLQEDGIMKALERITTIQEVMRVAYSDEG
ncbi:MAG: Flp pilus assembly complex ATPase component TadA [Clostridia bacterium]|nr:Flp pilus assembly complex ATPase component TadA [Clostridia bacterium]